MVIASFMPIERQCRVGSVSRADTGGGSTDISDIFKEFQEKTENSIESLETQITDMNTLQKKTESDLRALILEKEAGLQK